jgi:predicted nucleic acid-binding protein
MTDRIFLDTNLWIYLQDGSSGDKSKRVSDLIRDNAGIIRISTQVLGELYHVMTRKKIASPQVAGQAVRDLLEDFPVLNIDPPNVKKALEINLRYGYTYWDSLILATALSANCTIVYSEDMQHSQLVESQLRIVNPFI